MKKISSLSASHVGWMLAVFGFLIYSNTFKSAFVCDDPIVISQNPAIRHLDVWNLWQAFNTRFVVGLSLAFNYALGRENVVGYHLFNLVVHVLNSFLVYQLVCLTFKTPRMSKSSLDPKLVGFLTALVFLTHPLQTQAVTYIWQRATSLAAFFYLGALVFYIKSRLKPSGIHYGLCLLLTLWGMFTKEIVFTLPFMIVLYEFVFFKHKKFLLLVPILLTLFLIPWGMTQTSGRTIKLLKPPTTALRHGQSFIQNTLEMTRALGEDKMPRKDFVLTELNVLRTYLRLFVLPVKQSVDYDYPRARSLLESNTFLSFLLLLSLFGGGVVLLKKHPLLSFGIFWFFLTVSVEALVAQEEFIFEHRMYLPMVGVGLCLVYLVNYLSKNKPRPLTLLILVMVTDYSFLTYQRNFVWKDEFTLWDDAVRKAPMKARGYYNRGVAYQKKGLTDQALADYNKAIDLKPDLVDPYIDRASLQEKMGRPDNALTDLNKAIQLDPENVDAFYKRALIYHLEGLLDPALDDLNRVIRLNPDYAVAYYARGSVLAKKGLPDKAILDLNKAIQMRPGFTEAYNNRAILLEEMKNGKK